MPVPEQPPWDHQAMGEILGSQPEPVEDMVLGAGHRFYIGPEQALHLEIYPGSQATRLISQDAKIELYRQEQPYLYTEGVVFERRTAQQHLQLFVPPSGGATLDIVPATASAAPESSTLGVTEPHQANALPRPIATVTVDSGAPETPSQDPSPLPHGQEQDEQPRVTLHGRVGASPTFRTTRNGVLVAQFPLGVHEEDDKTAWHTIVAFKERAEKLKGSLKKGQPVDVIGYLHVTEQKAKDGTPKRIEQIYAVAIKQR